jgi:dihydrofolate reductase
MRTLSAFNFITLNGFISGINDDINWHKHGEEENQYASESLKSGNVLLFGRRTYEMMAGYWPTPKAMQNDPSVAGGMNNAEKIVFSKTLKTAGWKNTKIIAGNIVEEVRKLKQMAGNNMTLLGSGSIVTLFAGHGLIDEFEIMIDPIAIGSGISIFKGIKQPLDLRLTNVRTFKSGVVLLSYKSQFITV